MKALQFPEEDAKAIGELLKKGGYEVELLLGKAAKREAVRRKLKKLSQQGSADGVVLVGLFGHGEEVVSRDEQQAEVRESCFCPYDTSLRTIKDSGGNDIVDGNRQPIIEPDPATLVKLSELMTALKLAKPGNRVVLADCCRTVPNQARGRSSFGAGFRAQDLPENTSILFGCSPNEQAFEHPDWGHGAFTKCLLEEVRTMSAHGDVETAVLAGTLKKKVPALVASVSPRNAQTPKLFATDSVDLQLRSEVTQTPDLLVAPFKQSQAWEAQEQWAKSLHTKRERTNSIGQTMVLIPPGEFDMGNEDSVDELLKLFPYAKKEWFEDAVQRHRVRITKPFALGKHEVTIGQFRRFVNDTGYKTDAEKDGKGGGGYDNGNYKQDPKFSWKQAGFDHVPTDEHPVVNVSWNDAVAFCNWLSRQESKPAYYKIDGDRMTVVGGTGYRLPTEAEWEYACRAGTTTRYHSGNDPESLASVGNVADGTFKERVPTANGISAKDGYVYTAPVGKFASNNFGLNDMHGNVWEWCGDWYAGDYYGTSPGNDPSGSSSGSVRVNRGGCWFIGASHCRSANRIGYAPDHRSSFLGFRVAGVPSSQ